MFRKPCPNINLWRRPPDSTQKDLGDASCASMDDIIYCFSLRVLRSEHLLWIGSLAFTKLKLSNLQQFWYSMVLFRTCCACTYVIIYAVQFYQGVFSRHHFSCALSGYNMCQFVPTVAGSNSQGVQDYIDLIWLDVEHCHIPEASLRNFWLKWTAASILEFGRNWLGEFQYMVMEAFVLPRTC